MSEPGDAPIQVQLRIERIYLKDASFESPRSPGIFASSWRPEIKVDLNTRATHIEGDRHEVVLRITVEASTGEEETGFIAEVQQAGLFVIEGAPGEHLRRVIGTACPATLFPYAREALDALVVKGGFPALSIAPVNFEAIYNEALRQASEPPQETQH